MPFLPTVAKHAADFLTTILACLFTLALDGAGQAATLVDVNNEGGHAFLVSYRGNCYAVMPKHVAKTDRLALVSALPQTTGVATVFWRHVDEDLAIAYVEGDLSEACELRWSALSAQVGPQINAPGSGGLSRINWAGVMLDRAEGVITDADDETFVVTTTDNWAEAEVEGGVSGALFYKGTAPIGMALSTLSNRQARFLRMDRVFALIDPVLAGKSGAHPSTGRITAGSNGLGFRVTGQAIVDGGVLKGLSGTSQWPWTGAPVELELTLSNEAPVPINRIALQSTPSADVAMPQRITVALDVGMPGSPFWRAINADDMSPSGVLDIPTGGSRARRVKLRIESVWGQGAMVGLDSIVLE